MTGDGGDETAPDRDTRSAHHADRVDRGDAWSPSDTEDSADNGKLEFAPA